MKMKIVGSVSVKKEIRALQKKRKHRTRRVRPFQNRIADRDRDRRFFSAPEPSQQTGICRQTKKTKRRRRIFFGFFG
jgi:hypothetical protein